MANRLSDATSPYLRQHADNPVDWFEWGEEAFTEARRRDVPVFLSVGYSSCHWCHVMAHESFEDPEVAAQLNRDFVSIKVDREERPDVDAVYMAAVQAMSGHGGWPMSAFLDADAQPFFAGTYWPKHDRQGMPGFIKVLGAVAQAWRDDRAAITGAGRRLAAHLEEQQDFAGGGAGFDAGVADRAAAAALSLWDSRLGGFGAAPKFPQAMLIEFLLAHHRRTGDAGALRAATHSLEAMARGGIYDHLAGGFARYATDANWLVPHFEKMLYDNALLLRAYVHGWQVTGAATFRRVAEETARYLVAEMRQERGGFSSATDADSEGVEGKFFVWTAAEFDEVVAMTGEDPAEWRACFGVVEAGNWHDPHGHAPAGANVLHEAVARDETDHDHAMRLANVRAALRGRRDTRVPPGLDDKVLTSWNALALGALAETGAALGREDWVAAAAQTARFLRSVAWVDGRLRHSWSPARPDEPARIDAFLEDVAYLAQALLVLYEADGDPAWLQWARELADDAEARFADGEGGYYATADDAERLLVRPKDLWDNATPGGASVMADVQLRLAALLGEPDRLDLATRTLGLFADRAERAPTGYGEMLRSGERLLGDRIEVAIVGSAGDREPLAAVYRETWRPAAVLAVGDGHTDGGVPLLEHRSPVDGEAAAYVCRDFVCDRPVTEPPELRALLT